MIHIIKFLIVCLGYNIKRLNFLVLSLVGINGNEQADRLAFSTKSHKHYSTFKIAAYDLLMHRKLLL